MCLILRKTFIVSPNSFIARPHFESITAIKRRSLVLLFAMPSSCSKVAKYFSSIACEMWVETLSSFPDFVTVTGMLNIVSSTLFVWLFAILWTTYANLSLNARLNARTNSTAVEYSMKPVMYARSMITADLPVRADLAIRVFLPDWLSFVINPRRLITMNCGISLTILGSSVSIRDLNADDTSAFSRADWSLRNEVIT